MTDLFSPKDSSLKGLSELEILQPAVNRIKVLIENAISHPWINIDGKQLTGTEAKNALIRTQEPINLLHDTVKRVLISKGINENNIHPRLGDHNGELKLTGLLKAKDQDVCVLPQNHAKIRKREKITFSGLLNGMYDSYGQELTEKILSINVRSQLSSAAKNFDTLYERTFAEPLNLHLRCNKMVMGDFYLIPVYEYDDEQAKNNKVAFKDRKIDVKKYIKAFSALNMRENPDTDFYKYERVCLLIVDFNKRIPKIYNTTQELINDGVLEKGCDLSMDNLHFEGFISRLINVYSQRFGDGQLI